MRNHLTGLVAVLALASAPLAAQEQDLFSRLDSNKDGYVSADEVQEAQKGLFERLLRTSDKNSDGKLSQEEFQAGLNPPEQPRQPLGGGFGPGRGRGPGPGGPPDRAGLEAMFDRMDANNDGKLTKDEIPEERQGMRQLLERLGGDSVTKEQFLRGMMAMGPGPGQPRPDGVPQRAGGPPPGGRVLAAIDADGDGQLSNAEIVGAGTALLKLDRNGDGKLTQEELFGPGGPPAFGRRGEGRPAEGRPGEGRPGERRPGQRGFGGASPEEFRQRLKDADTNGDGKLTKEEAPPMLRQRFDQMDANSDGFVDEEEMRQMLRRLGDGPARRP
jgi:Ca2+-binding EF-hand superfamily protein